MTQEFIEARIKEQNEYIEKVGTFKIPEERRQELLSSAEQQKTYFENELNKLNKHKGNDISKSNNG